MTVGRVPGVQALMGWASWLGRAGWREPVLTAGGGRCMHALERDVIGA